MDRMDRSSYGSCSTVVAFQGRSYGALNSSGIDCRALVRRNKACLHSDWAPCTWFAAVQGAKAA